jgi:hypothetical protein
MYGLRIGVCLAFSFVLATSAASQESECKKYKKEIGYDCLYKSGVFFKELPYESTIFAHDSFGALTSFRSDQDKKAPLEPQDYYYLFSVSPSDTVTFSNCKSTSSIFDELFGETETSLVAVTLSVDYRLTPGTDIKGVQSLPILMVGHGVNPTNGTNTNGCFFFPPKTVNSTYVRYTGGDKNASFEDFQAQLVGKTATAFKSNYVATLTALIKSIASAWPLLAKPVDLTPAQGEAISGIGKQFEEAFNKAGTVSNEWNQVVLIKALGGRKAAWEITAPGATKKAKVIVYVYRSASKAVENLPGTIVKRKHVLGNKRLGTAELDFGDAAKRKTFLASYAAGNAALNSDPLFDTSTVDARKLLGKKCAAVRTHATDTLELSTFDATLVRWAALGDFGDVLLQPEELAKVAADSGLSPAALLKVCLAKEDQDLLRGVLGKLGKRLEGDPAPTNLLTSVKAVIKPPQKPASVN